MQKKHRQALLGSLHPSDGFDLPLLSIKPSSRPFGTQLQPLPQLSRTPELSRGYLPGDPIKYIDWRAFARSDTLIVRQKKEDISSRVNLFIDLSDSMYWPADKDCDEIAKSLRFHSASTEDIPTYQTKSALAMRLALHLAAQHLKKGDQVRLWFDLNHLKAAVARESSNSNSGISDKSDAMDMSYSMTMQSVLDINSLFHQMFGARFTLAPLMHLLRQRSALEIRGDIGYWLGDAIDHPQFGEYLQASVVRVLFHVLSPLEMNLKWVQSDTSYQFPVESQVMKEYLGADLLAEEFYANQLNAWLDRLENQCYQLNSYYFMVHQQMQISLYFKYLGNLSMQTAGH